MITILGAGGVIANHLTPLLAGQKQPVPRGEPQRTGRAGSHGSRRRRSYGS